MTSIIDVQYSIDSVLDIETHHENFGITPLQARLYKNFYGLQNIAVCTSKTIEDLICEAISKIFNAHPNLSAHDIEYVVFARTSLTNAPFSYGLISKVLSKNGLPNAKRFCVNLNKCASTVEAFEVVDNIFASNDAIRNILLISSEVAVTNQQRVLHNATIAGDAAGCVLFSRNNHYANMLQYVAFSKISYPEFYKGAWLNAKERANFEKFFPDMMSEVIKNCTYKAKLELDQVRYILPHNVNYPVWKSIGNNLRCQSSKIFTDNICKYGHCSSADALINLSSVWNVLKSDDYVLTATVGFGLTFAAAIFKKVDSYV